MDELLETTKIAFKFSPIARMVAEHICNQPHGQVLAKSEGKVVTLTYRRGTPKWALKEVVTEAYKYAATPKFD